jgi:Hemolysins and related proteins containing CBS domains
LDKSEKPRKKGKKAEAAHDRWVLRIFLIAIALSAALSLLSETTLNGAGILVAVIVLVIFILLGILFDIIGVAVTAADERPFHSMAAHREAGAGEALGLLHNASRVSSFCNDVVGDICGIVSGTTGAVIAARAQSALNAQTVLFSVGVTALISGLTIGGKALGKNFAISRSTQVVFTAGKFLHFFHRSGN